MNKYENNAYFWQKIDTLCLSGDFKEVNEKGSVHKQYPNLKYPCSYGYIKDSLILEDNGIQCFKGTNGSDCESAVICADILKREIDVKLLIGVNEQEEDDILRFLNQTDFQKTVLIRKGNDLPGWSETD